MSLFLKCLSNWRSDFNTSTNNNASMSHAFKFKSPPHKGLEAFIYPMDFCKLDLLCCTVYYMLNYFFPLTSYITQNTGHPQRFLQPHRQHNFLRPYSAPQENTETTATMATEVRIRTLITVRGRHYVPRPRYRAPIFDYAHTVTAHPSVLSNLLPKLPTIFIFWSVTTTTDRQTDTHTHEHNTHTRTHTHGHGQTHTRTHTRARTHTQTRTHTHKHTHTDTNTHTHTHKDTDKNTHTHGQGHTHALTRTHTQGHADTYTRTHTRTRKHTRTHTHAHIHGHKQAHANTYTHTHAHGHTYAHGRTRMHTYTHTRTRKHGHLQLTVPHMYKQNLHIIPKTSAETFALICENCAFFRTKTNYKKRPICSNIFRNTKQTETLQSELDWLGKVTSTVEQVILVTATKSR